MSLVLATRPVGRYAVSSSVRSHWTAIAVYGAASTLGGATTAAVLVSAGALVGSAGSGPISSLLAACCVAIVIAAVIAEASGRMGPFPQRHAQVPRRWLAWGSPNRVGAVYGYVLGAAVFTYLHHAVMYVLGVLILLAPSPQAGVLIGATYGFTRGLVLLVVSIRSGRAESGLPPSYLMVDRIAAGLPLAALASAGAALIASRLPGL